MKLHSLIAFTLAGAATAFASRCALADSATTAPAQAPSTAPAGEKDLKRLVELLGNDDFKVRTEAQEKLVSLGEQAVPALNEAKKSNDPEIQQRADAALKSIEQKKHGPDMAAAEAARKQQAEQQLNQGLQADQLDAINQLDDAMRQVIDALLEARKAQSDAMQQQINDAHQRIADQRLQRLQLDRQAREQLREMEQQELQQIQELQQQKQQIEQQMDDQIRQIQNDLEKQKQQIRDGN